MAGSRSLHGSCWGHPSNKAANVPYPQDGEVCVGSTPWGFTPDCYLAGFQPGCLREQLRHLCPLSQLEKSGGFDLLDALAHDTEDAPDRLEGMAAAVVEAEAQEIGRAHV